MATLLNFLNWRNNTSNKFDKGSNGHSRSYNNTEATTTAPIHEQFDHGAAAAAAATTTTTEKQCHFIIIISTVLLFF